MGEQFRDRLVPDPMITDSEYLYQQNRERDRAAARSTKPRLDIGMVTVQENAILRIGALCFIRHRAPHHEVAAERFKAMYEALYGCGAPAMDASRIQVDTSPIAHDSGMAAKIDRHAAMRQAEMDMGKPAFNRLVALLVLCVPAGEGLTSRPRQRSVDTVLSDLDCLATLWGYRSKAA